MEQKKTVPAGNDWLVRDIRYFSGSPVSRVGDGWMLITAGAAGNWNTMTASWGGLGVLWGKPAAFMFIRPTRYTFNFSEKASLFTLSFFDESWRKALSLCGSRSGRDTDKAAETGLTPIVFEDGGISFQEARDIVSCRKTYFHDFDPRHFVDPSIEEHYPQKDYHRMYIGEILTYRAKA